MDRQVLCRIVIQFETFAAASPTRMLVFKPGKQLIKGMAQMEQLQRPLLQGKDATQPYQFPMTNQLRSTLIDIPTTGATINTAATLISTTFYTQSASATTTVSSSLSTSTSSLVSTASNAAATGSLQGREAGLYLVSDSHPVLEINKGLVETNFVIGWRVSTCCSALNARWVTLVLAYIFYPDVLSLYHDPLSSLQNGSTTGCWLESRMTYYLMVVHLYILIPRNSPMTQLFAAFILTHSFSLLYLCPNENGQEVIPITSVQIFLQFGPSETTSVACLRSQGLIRP
jgi:hypothetical protein